MVLLPSLAFSISSITVLSSSPLGLSDKKKSLETKKRKQKFKRSGYQPCKNYLSYYWSSKKALDKVVDLPFSLTASLQGGTALTRPTQENTVTTKSIISSCVWKEKCLERGNVYINRLVKKAARGKTPTKKKIMKQFNERISIFMIILISKSVCILHWLTYSKI